MKLIIGRNKLSLLSATGLILGLAQTAPLSSNAVAQEVQFSAPYQQDRTSSKASPTIKKQTVHGGEHYRARGNRPPPPGYQEAPSMEFQNGPDPDHQAKVQRDKTTGADLSKFGTAYQDSNPTQSGELGDATGNGWVAPRGNGFQY
ncbi:hypothetical protein [Aristophania vespae]|uniref:hypothetical protein n=1 Tax=Aristophania vespae TaxID=2697033 RepID=UPI00191C56C5|nr:hypothetical protein [Aristophania vespae]UMM64562.1 hypothetical protein DM15PD_15780 [Aristophania vespae]